MKKRTQVFLVLLNITFLTIIFVYDKHNKRDSISDFRMGRNSHNVLRNFRLYVFTILFNNEFSETYSGDNEGATDVLHVGLDLARDVQLVAVESDSLAISLKVIL